MNIWKNIQKLEDNSSCPISHSFWTLFGQSWFEQSEEKKDPITMASNQMQRKNPTTMARARRGTPPSGCRVGRAKRDRPKPLLLLGF